MVDEKSEKKSSIAEGPDTEAGLVSSEVLVDKNGFVLFPVPVQGDALDPLNWSAFQKHTILGIVMALYD